MHVLLQQDTQPAVSTDTDGGSDGISRASQLLPTSDMDDYDSLMQVRCASICVKGSKR